MTSCERVAAQANVQITDVKSAVRSFYLQKSVQLNYVQPWKTARCRREPFPEQRHIFQPVTASVGLFVDATGRSSDNYTASEENTRGGRQGAIEETSSYDCSKPVPSLTAGPLGKSRVLEVGPGRECLQTPCLLPRGHSPPFPPYSLDLGPSLRKLPGTGWPT